MAAPDLFGILDVVKKLTAPPGLETAHVDGFSWARNGLSYGDSTKLTADDWNRIIANLRVVLIGSGVDLSTLDPADPELVKTVLQLYLGMAVTDILSGVDVGGYGMMAKAIYDANNDGLIDIDHGGTGASSLIDAADNLSAMSADIASAATTDLGDATGINVRITGTSAISSFGSAPDGAVRRLTFAAPLTLTYNATSMILPGAADMQVAAGDTALMQSLGSGNWRMVGFLRASGAPVIDTIILKQGANPLPTAEGDARWDTDDNIIVVGDGAGQKLFLAAPAGVAAGDLFYASGPKVLTRLPKGAARRTLRMDAGATVPEWGGGNGPADAVLEDQKPSGTSGGSSAPGNGAWAIHTLNTKVRDPYSLVALASNVFTPANDGWVEWQVGAHAIPIQARLYDVTAGAEVATGIGTVGNSSPNSGSMAVGGAVVVGGHAYRLEYRTSATNADGLGIAFGFGSIEVYARLKYWGDA
ncbi:MAG: hypothetical protein EOS24_05015 [Mesorhizobium sp.]|uniref:hypothetical protein n=2 Tax=Mesorhizobium sp. TaxID=1871066 RepID=UPI000FE9E307|nr:hypothetical protein [Mesorhizobium sp.]RWE62978.1 MAG: hypothetical protein EOS24_05015 [Mesorhizobium sp.]RWF10572.1 MAG: hypothetical protein EOS69_14435 [Mesorhizobium sp.]